MTPWEALAAEMRKMGIRMVQDPPLGPAAEQTLEQQALWAIAALSEHGFQIVPRRQ